MSGIGPFPPLQSLSIGLTDAALLAVVLTGGLVSMSIRNMFDSILFDDDEAASVDAGNAGPQGSGEEEGMADGGLMAEGGDDFGDLGGLDDDGGDGFGGDDFGDDEFGDMDDAGAGTDELEHRLDELENEVGSLSSTVNTVRTENEQISESVEEVEENVRKLLDIYEMVTRGVNPFADDIEAGMGGGGMSEGSSFGLFDDGDGSDGDGGEEALDEDIASADAEGFFDEDLVDDGEDDFDVDDGDFADGDDVFDDGEGAEDFGDGFGDDEDFDDSFDDDFADDADAGGDDGGDGGKSFQELKDEYDSGDADWAEGEEPEDAASAEASTADAEAAEPTEDDAEDLAEDELFDEVIEDDGLDADDGSVDATPEPTVNDEAASQPEPEPAATATDAAAETEASAETTESTAQSADAAQTGAGKPYLAELPAGFAADLIVMEWMEFLTDRSSYRATDDAIDYYDRIDWISPTVADELRDYLRGFDSIEGDGGSLTIDDHKQSLQYISQLDGDGASVALSKLVGGGGNGLQR